MSYLPPKPMKKVLREEEIAIDTPQKTYTAQSNSMNGITHTIYKPTQMSKPVVTRSAVIKK